MFPGGKPTAGSQTAGPAASPERGGQGPPSSPNSKDSGQKKEPMTRGSPEDAFLLSRQLAPSTFTAAQGEICWQRVFQEENAINERIFTNNAQFPRPRGGIHPAEHAVREHTIVSVFHPLLVPVTPAGKSHRELCPHQHPLPGRRSHPSTDIQQLNDEHQRAALAPVCRAQNPRFGAHEGRQPKDSLNRLHLGSQGFLEVHGAGMSSCHSSIPLQKSNQQTPCCARPFPPVRCETPTCSSNVTRRRNKPRPANPPCS